MAETKEYKAKRFTYQLDGSYAPDLSKAKRMSKPPFIRPLSLPTGAIITGKLTDVQESEVGTGKKKRKNVSLSLTCVGSNIKAIGKGSEFSFPMNTVMEGALGETVADVLKHKGKEITFKVLEPRKSANFGKEYFNCEVFIN